LALVALNLKEADLHNNYTFGLTAISVILLGASLAYLYQCTFPQLRGGSRSLIYFQEIAKRNENRFIEEFSKQTIEQYKKDLLGQVWRNSEILRMKFRYLKIAFTLTAAAILPWFLLLLIATISN